LKRIKKYTAIMLICSIILSISAPCLAAGNGLELVAHRGFSSVAPENTIAAVDEAGKNSFFGCEFDIRTTKDNVWVVMHDNLLSTMTDETARISELTYDELKNIRITKGNGIENYPNETIPTLVEMLDACAKWGLHPVIEIKNGNTEAIAELCDILNARREKKRMTVISFNATDIVAVKTALPSMTCLFLTEDLCEKDLEFALDNGLDGISFDCSKYNSDVIASAHAQGLLLNSWAVDDEETAKKLYSDGVKSITTNTLDPSHADSITGTVKGPLFSVIVVSFSKNLINRILRLLKLF